MYRNGQFSDFFAIDVKQLPPPPPGRLSDSETERKNTFVLQQNRAIKASSCIIYTRETTQLLLYYCYILAKNRISVKVKLVFTIILLGLA